MSLDPGPLDPAAQAFERLRLEVALLRRAVEGLSGEGAEPAPDYSPTLARLAKAVAAVDARVEALAAVPALALTPEQLGLLVVRAANEATTSARAELGRDRVSFEQAAGRLDQVVLAWRARCSRRRLVMRVAAAGFVAGASAWAALLGPFARTLPSGWQVPERLAAAILKLPRDAAGARLLAGAQPVEWRRLQFGAAILSGDPRAAEACAVRAARAEAAVRCIIWVMPAAGAASGLRAPSDPHRSGG